MELIVFHAPSIYYTAALALRNEVLRKPLGLEFTPAELEKDLHDTHLAYFDGDNVLCCLTLTDSGSSVLKMRQVAVQSAHQRKGLGRQLCIAAESWARESGYKKIFCHARDTAVPFYQHMGYQIEGGGFTEVGIPHYSMQKAL